MPVVWEDQRRLWNEAQVCSECVNLIAVESVQKIAKKEMRVKLHMFSCTIT